MITCYIGTRAQLIKMAPVVLEIERRGMPLTLVMTGQHCETMQQLMTDFGMSTTPIYLYEGREISLGARSGNYFIVESGLREGENVVTNGNFKIDSSFQILAKSSMMTLPGENDSEPVTVAPAEQEIKIKNAPPPPDEILQAYFAVQKALFAENLGEALKNAAKLDERYESSLVSAKDLNAARKDFDIMSKRFYREISSSSENLKTPVYKFFCLMAFNNKGAFWLQDNDRKQNPYFGPAMPTCGELKETIPGVK